MDAVIRMVAEDDDNKSALVDFEGRAVRVKGLKFDRQQPNSAREKVIVDLAKQELKKEVEENE